MSRKIFEKNLIAICKNKVTLMPNKPAYVGMCILELNKVSMYEFHYDYIVNKYCNNSELLFTVTHRLMYEIKTGEDFSSNKDMFDFSNYSSKSKYYDGSYKLVIGKIKDETGVVIMNAKMFC